MPNAFPREPAGSGPADRAEARTDESSISEFLSEDSPELNAAWPAETDTPPESVASLTPPAAVAPVVAKATTVAPAAAAPVVVARGAAPPTIVRPVGTGVGFWRRLMMITGVAAVVVTGAWFVQARRVSEATGTTPPAVAEGTATIMSRPEGAEVFIDGESRGITPLRLSLPVGTYAMDLRNGAATRSLTLTIEAATAVRETVDLAPSAALGRLDIRTDVAGARVSVDGVPRGVTPLVVSGLTPGQHRVTLSRGDITVYRTATVRAGATAEIVASVAPPAASGGWLTFRVPIEMLVIVNGELLGTTRTGRLMVPAGRHTLQLVAEPYGFRTTATAVVGAGETVAIPVALPNGRLSINAVPWANVWLDGRPIGPTPVANMAVPIGDHEVIWRHPDLGERRQSVRVAASTPLRVDVDLNR